uniref:PAS domain-containing protein n=1 Tax=Pontiella sp. TaxID=2837462 RepID=UPI003567DA07
EQLHLFSSIKGWLFIGVTALLLYFVLQRNTRRIEAHAAQLSYSEEKYRGLFNNAPLPYQSLDENGCFLDVNPAWLRNLGYDRDEVIGRWFGDFLHPDLVQHFETNFPTFKKRGYVKDVQFRIRHKNGEYRHIEFEGCVGYLPDGSFRQTYCVFQDITARKRAEEALLASEQRFRTICENAPALINGFDEAGRCILWNKQCRKTFGWTAEEINEHEDAPSLFYPDPAVRAEMFRTVTTDPDGHFREWHPITRDGKTLTTIWANFRLPDGQVFSLGLDMTEQRKAQRELEEYREHLEELVQERTREMRVVINSMAGREVRMAEFKETIAALQSRLEAAGLSPIAHQAQPTPGNATP